jgi:hypothetical protein
MGCIGNDSRSREHEERGVGVGGHFCLAVMVDGWKSVKKKKKENRRAEKEEKEEWRSLFFVLEVTPVHRSNPRYKSASSWPIIQKRVKKRAEPGKKCVLLRDSCSLNQDPCCL